MQDISEHVDLFLQSRKSCDRYASFDFCFNHFNPTNKIDFRNDIEKSCLALGFYLASWGMFRGSSFLLNRSARHFVPLIEYFSVLDNSIWGIDANSYSDENVEQLIELYSKIKETLIAGNNAHLTLVTKIMLGVFGSVPAYDQYFCNTFRERYKSDCAFRSFNKASLTCIGEFYKDNSDIIDNLRPKILDFYSGTSSIQSYTRAKIIDMYGFSKGIKKHNKKTGDAEPPPVLANHLPNKITAWQSVVS